MSKNDLIVSSGSNRTKEQLQRLQALPLEQKINLSLRRIDQFYRELDGKVYVSFSGGKDSTVLLHLVRRLFPNTPAVFADTGLEFPEIRDFVKNTEDVEWVKPKKPFTTVIKDYGYPVVSKEVSRYVRDLQNPTPRNETTRRIRLEGSSFKGGKSRTGMLSKKWLFLKDAPFRCSEQCCDVMKKAPMKKYEKGTKRKPFIGTMVDDSRLRKQAWYRDGCNSFDGNRVSSKPLSFWTEENIWEYMKKYNIKYSEIYDKGYERTGCVFCMFGYWAEKKRELDRFKMLESTHPKLHAYCMDKLGLRDVIDYIDNHLADPES
jgi:3'-phosphoadenosine 5'-phosphosulfate sulfotransferase (PAPS reductase)/FAD synthetase